MKSIKEIISNIKVFLQEQNLTDVKTIDGNILSFDGDLAIGVEIFAVDANGEKLPAADGEYELEDGTKIVIVGGIVDEIELAGADDAGEDVIEDAPAASGDTAPTMMSIEDLAAKVKCLEDDNAELKEALSLLADNIANLSLKKEVKMSSIEKEIKSVKQNNIVKHVNPNSLDAILQNMYKK